MAEPTLDGKGGLKLHLHEWRPILAPRATLAIVHGLRDHGARYGWAADRLAARGFAVHALDLRGHGRSQGAPAWVDAFDDYLEDLHAFLARVREREPGLPLFLFGHSMGGAIVTLYTLTRNPDLRGLLLSAPALKPGPEVSGALVAVSRVLSAALPRLPVLKLADRLFSRDAAAVREMQADPLVHQKPGPARTGAELLSALGRIGALMDKMRAPLLVMHGTRDGLTNPEGSKELFARAASSDKTLKLFDGLYHDLLHEPEKEQVLADIASWLEARA